MALPTAITDVELPRRPSYAGPVISSTGNVYTFLFAGIVKGRNLIRAMKAVDPTVAVTSAVSVTLESQLSIEADTGSIAVEVVSPVVTIEVVDPPAVEVNE